MTGVQEAVDTDAIAAEAIAALDGGRQVPPFSSRLPGFGLEEAYRVADIVRRVREARGERVVGRKIGFTNRTIWAEYRVYEPIWGYVYDRTVHELSRLEGGLSVSGFAEPRIEPEIVFGLATAPDPGMDELALLGSLAWVAHGFEIVQSIFPGWRFTAADTVAAFGVHGALLIGPRHPVAPAQAEWGKALASFKIDLLRDGKVADRGEARNVLGGPVQALHHLVRLLATDPVNPPLGAGEIVTTGTLTRALPIAPGETWSTRPSGVPLDGISLRLL